MMPKNSSGMILIVFGITLMFFGQVGFQIFGLASIVDNYRGINIKNGYGGVEFTYEGKTYGVYPTKYEARDAIDALLDSESSTDPDIDLDPAGGPSTPAGTSVLYRNVLIGKNEDLAWVFTINGVFYQETTLSHAKSVVDAVLDGTPEPDDPYDDNWIDPNTNEPIYPYTTPDQVSNPVMIIMGLILMVVGLLVQFGAGLPFKP